MCEELLMIYIFYLDWNTVTLLQYCDVVVQLHSTHHITPVALCIRYTAYHNIFLTIALLSPSANDSIVVASLWFSVVRLSNILGTEYYIR